MKPVHSMQNVMLQNVHKHIVKVIHMNLNLLTRHDCFIWWTDLI